VRAHSITSMSRLAYRSFVLLCVVHASACGGEPPAPEKNPAPAAKAKPEPLPAGDTATPPSGSTGAAAGTAADPFADDDGWETESDALTSDDSGGDDTGGDDTGGAETGAAAPPPPTGHPGPCTITWSTGTKVTFAYDGETSGSMKVDADNDGKPDVCGSFTLKDGKPTKISVDDGCDKKVSLEIKPKYLADQNLATATVVDTATKKKSSLTLVTLPSFTGVIPGYPLQAAKKKIGLTSRSGLVRTAHVKKPSEGPVLKASFFYDKAGRIKAVKEDFNADGTTDQRYDYRYDADGNINRIRLTQTSGEEVVKASAKLDYSCWK